MFGLLVRELTPCTTQVKFSQETRREVKVMLYTSLALSQNVHLHSVEE